MEILFLTLPRVVDQVTDTCSPASANLMYLWELRLEETITQRSHTTWWWLPELQGALVLVVTCPLGCLLFLFLAYLLVCLLCMPSKYDLFEFLALLSHILSPGVREFIHMLSTCCAPLLPRPLFSVSEYFSYAVAGTSCTFAQVGHCPSQGGHCYFSLCDWCHLGLGSPCSRMQHFEGTSRDLKCDIIPIELVTAPLENCFCSRVLTSRWCILVPLSLLSPFLSYGLSD